LIHSFYAVKYVYIYTYPSQYREVGWSKEIKNKKKRAGYLNRQGKDWGWGAVVGAGA
jgi:hypothetical protein